MIIALSCYLETQIVQFMKLKQIMLMKTFIKFFLFFDFSDYPQGSNFCDPVNRKVIGKIKDEF